MMGPAGNNVLDHIANVVNGSVETLTDGALDSLKDILLFKIACAVTSVSSYRRKSRFLPLDLDNNIT